MQHFMTPPELKVTHNYGDHTFGFHCIHIISEHDYQKDTRIGLFPFVIAITHIQGKSIELGLSIMNKIGISSKFSYGSNKYEIWNV